MDLKIISLNKQMNKILTSNKAPVVTESTCNPTIQTPTVQVIKCLISRVRSQLVAAPEIQTVAIVNTLQLP